MSTILYEDDKFLKIYQTLKCSRDGRDFACLFRYPEGWDLPGGMYASLQEFIDKLRQANIQAYNERYDDANELVISLLDFNRTVLPYGSKIQLYQSLNSIRYNIDDEDVDGCAEQLNVLIGQIAYDIISEMPEYQNANCW